jgi:hypothetical protein
MRACAQLGLASEAGIRYDPDKDYQNIRNVLLQSKNTLVNLGLLCPLHPPSL